MWLICITRTMDFYGLFVQFFQLVGNDNDDCFFLLEDIGFSFVFTSQIHVLVSAKSKYSTSVFILRVNMYISDANTNTLLANPKGGENPACPCFSLPLLIAFRLSRYQKRFPTTDISLTRKNRRTPFRIPRHPIASYPVSLTLSCK